MKKEKNTELLDFESLFRSETFEAYETYIKAEKLYEKTLKSFVSKNITGTKYFNKTYKATYKLASKNSGFDNYISDEVFTLLWMIDDFRSQLEDD
jgi:hypothetical protein